MSMILKMKLVLKLLGLLLYLMLAQSCAQEQEKINGISFVATRNPIDSSDIQPLQTRFNANHAAVIPYGFMRSLDSSRIIYNIDRQWWGERVSGTRETIRLMHQSGIKVMLKPQIWIGGGDYTGNINMMDHQQWKKLEDSYTTFILTYARLAAETDVEILCIGTEMDSFVREQPEYWQDLIQQIKSIYQGKLTYAANWDSYDEVAFWEQLDYIGVDAYFPVSDEKTPSLSAISKSWDKWKMEMNTLSRKRKKPILLTEYGYVSADYAGREPWKTADEDREVNDAAQAVLLEGLYKKLWDKEWIAGGFLWKYHAEPSRHGFAKRFTPQDKPAEKVVAKYYGL